MSKEIVLYRKYGVFSLSSKAVQWLMKERNWSCTTFTEKHKPLDSDADIIYKAPGTTFGYAKEGYHITGLNIKQMIFLSVQIQMSLMLSEHLEQMPVMTMTIY